MKKKNPSNCDCDIFLFNLQFKTQTVVPRYNHFVPRVSAVSYVMKKIYMYAVFRHAQTKPGRHFLAEQTQLEKVV